MLQLVACHARHGQTNSEPVADLHSKFWGGASKILLFHAVFGKFWQNRMLALPPPGELAPPPRGNPGSATESGSIVLTFIRIS